MLEGFKKRKGELIWCLLLIMGMGMGKGILIVEELRCDEGVEGMVMFGEKDGGILGCWFVMGLDGWIIKFRFFYFIFLLVR